VLGWPAGSVQRGHCRRHAPALGCLADLLQAPQGAPSLPLPPRLRAERERAPGHRQSRDQGLEQIIQRTKRKLGRLYKQLAKSKPSTNKDGTPRANGKSQRLATAIAEQEAELRRLGTEKAQLPERIDVGGLSDYRSFQAIDNEGKNLFDFVTAAVWNARRQLIDWLAETYAKDSDRVDLLYAILNCHGWIRSDDRWVVVRLEPLQQPARRYAQEQLCRKLNGLGAKIPGGKWLRIEVGDSPL
jgi:hypothetical protein